MNMAILLSGGSGTRLGGHIPKQYIKVKGRMIVTATLEGLIRNPLIDFIQIVADGLWRDKILEDAKDCQMPIKKIRGFSKPGENRQMSIYNALLDLSLWKMHHHRGKSCWWGIRMIGG